MKIANSLNTNFNNTANNMRIKRLRETFSVGLFLDSKNQSALSVNIIYWRSLNVMFFPGLLFD